MVEDSDEPSLLYRFRSSLNASRLILGKAQATPVLPVEEKTRSQDALPSHEPSAFKDGDGTSKAPDRSVDEDAIMPLPPPAPPPAEKNGDGGPPTAVEAASKPKLIIRIYRTVKEILLHSYINLLLVFVPAGIAVGALKVNPTVVFALNAIAIVPLAGLLSHATEVVASRLGDTLGALLNVSFGNAVELIIFIIALIKNEIEIVQASLVGSILSNLLLILGMAFLLGGLRFREQVYNSTVTQMSACLLSLSVTSLLLPTAFHASFSNKNSKEAMVAVIELSRGSSVILLLIYVLYLLFQLKSHAYMYASTPQHVIDEESHPGVLADMLNTSSSSDSGSSSDGDSSHSSGSQTTAKRLKRAFRGRKRRKSSASSKDSPVRLSRNQTPSDLTFSDALRTPSDATGSRYLTALTSGDEADDDGTALANHRKGSSKKKRLKAKLAGSSRANQKTRSKGKRKEEHLPAPSEHAASSLSDQKDFGTARITREPSKVARVAFAADAQAHPESSPKRPFNIRNLSSTPVMPRMLGPTVFSSANVTGATTASSKVIVPAPYGLRRTSSLPDRLNRPPSVPAAHHLQTANGDTQSLHSHRSAEEEEPETEVSRISAVILLLVSTALVAACAEFLVGSINYMVVNADISEAFIGLILLPIIGNAAEHVTAVTVAAKNKMDLAIGIAVGSSIQARTFYLL